MLVRDRAARLGPDLFLLDRAFDDVLDRIAAIHCPTADALLIGSLSPLWFERLTHRFRTVHVIETGQEAASDLSEGRFDIAVAVGTLDTVNDLPSALLRVKRSLRPGSPLLGAMAGGNSLPTLRSALIEGERSGGSIAQRVHPRIDAPTLVGLFDRVGFQRSVVDIDRVTLRYPSLDGLVRDLRAMGATNQLASIAPLSRQAAMAAAAAFKAKATDGKTAETIEILHFAGWSPT